GDSPQLNGSPAPGRHGRPGLGWFSKCERLVGMTADFDRLIEPHRRELFAHCYRMLGSPHDAEDALQDALLAAWRGMEGFAGRSSARTWLYRVTTNACLR